MEIKHPNRRQKVEEFEIEMNDYFKNKRYSIKLEAEPKALVHSKPYVATYTLKKLINK
jgi:hypothetical protein